MKFRSEVEPPQPMRGLEVPPDVVDSLAGGKRPRVRVTINGHTWSTRIAIMRGRHLIGLSNANRVASRVDLGEEVEIEVELDNDPIEVHVPEDLAEELAADPAARSAYDRLTLSQKRQHIRMIENAKKPETRMRRLRNLVHELRNRS